jgi:hypothetical protein
MRAAGLEALDVVMTTEAVLISNPHSMHGPLVEKIKKRTCAVDCLCCVRGLITNEYLMAMLLMGMCVVDGYECCRWACVLLMDVCC